MPRYRKSFDSVESESIFPVTDGKMKPLGSAYSPALSRTASAAPLSGTRCSRPFFILAAGTVQVAESRSTSSQRAPRTSPERQAVKVRNSMASFVTS